MLEPLAHHVDARGLGATTPLADRAVGCGDGQLQPRVALAVAGGEHHRPDPCGRQVQGLRRVRERHGPRALGRPDLTGQPALLDVPVDGVEEAVHLLVGFADRVGQVVGEAHPLAVGTDDVTGEPDTPGLQRAEVEVADW